MRDKRIEGNGTVLEYYWWGTGRFRKQRKYGRNFLDNLKSLTLSGINGIVVGHNSRYLKYLLSIRNIPVVNFHRDFRLTDTVLSLDLAQQYNLQNNDTILLTILVNPSKALTFTVFAQTSQNKVTSVPRDERMGVLEALENPVVKAFGATSRFWWFDDLFVLLPDGFLGPPIEVWG
ncbi:hypothetical protein K435DRAFT_805335 [Dendrothele bispora CBS 962.96]|uniref:Uncharacterized protein n=1 Tax=Dendrothele bispora (strain CBS 962.96) TaxID=1314807 RepID=A0A4S8LC14_DENBC|nr:hypothetical protein K435DRAFT_805335 [Dendrothele bispora CBS 962.96]